ncbi:MAG TPA: cation diffusion facilitator family transporter [Oculatellaceae cyanobacterium]
MSSSELEQKHEHHDDSGRHEELVTDCHGPNCQSHGISAATALKGKESGASGNPNNPGNSSSSNKEHKHSHGSGGHRHSHGHSHGNLREQSKSRMIFALALLTSFMLIEAITGFTCGSLALLADAGHMLGDVAGILLALLAIWFSSKPATPGKTYGYYRSEILASFCNSLALVGISLFIMYEAYQRFSNPPQVMALPTLIVAILGLIVNIISLKALSSSAEQSLNARAAYLEIFSDSLASVGVIISSLLIIFFHLYFVDALISGLIALAILPRTWGLLKECMNILMEGTPGHIDLDNLRKSMLAVTGVVDVHDIHVWTITSGLDAMSAHVTIDEAAPASEVLDNLTLVVNDDFSIHHSTIQVEAVRCSKLSDPCHG